jgi:tetratricopeptide (TPR) repeat protein
MTHKAMHRGWMIAVFACCSALPSGCTVKQGPAPAGADDAPEPRAPARLRPIAVLALKNLRPHPQTDWIGPGAAETLTTKLAGVPGLVPVERAQTQRVLDEQAFGQLDLCDPAAAAKVGKFIGAERMVVGTFVSDGAGILFNVRVVDVETATVLHTAAVRASKSDIFDALFRLAEAVVASFQKKAVFVDARPVVRAAPPAEWIALTDDLRRVLRQRGTTSTKAYEAFCRGLQTTDAAGRIAWYSRAIGLDPRYAWAYNNRGVAYYEQGRFTRALDDFGRAIQLEPNYAIAHNNHGLVYAAIRDYPRAIRAFGRSISHKPFPEVFYNRGNMYADMGRHEAAVRDYSRAIRLRADYVDAYVNRGTAYYHMADPRRAVQDFDRAIALRPGLAAAYYNRGLAYRRLGRLDRAVADYGRAIRLKPDFAQAYHSRALACYALREYRKAWADVQTCQRLGVSVDSSLLDALQRATGQVR